jgi:hypothetical protein
MWTCLRRALANCRKGFQAAVRRDVAAHRQKSGDVNKAVKAGWAVERGWEDVMRGRGRRRVL